jgi:hypothetical protein
MRKTLGFSLILAFSCLPVSAQTAEACRAQLRHLTVPEYPRAFSVLARDGKAKLPSRLLFSDGGIEVYADTFPDGRDDFLTQISSNGLKVLIVYQDEAVRQSMVKQLRQGDALPPSGTGALVENLKYAEVLFTPEWLPSDLAPGNKMGNPFSREWSIWHVEYDQPQQCMNVFQNDVHPTLYNAYSSSTQIIAETDPIHIKKLSPNRFPIWTKALQAMLTWAKRCVALVDH